MKITHLTDEEVIELSKKLMAEGKVIEAGFLGLWKSIGRPDNQKYIADMRTTFFAGAYHVFQTIMSTLDPGVEPTDDDMLRMKQMQDEMDTFIAKFEAEVKRRMN